jgi:DNA-binding beta-propeller fold protein YncE
MRAFTTTTVPRHPLRWVAAAGLVATSVIAASFVTQAAAGAGRATLTSPTGRYSNGTVLMDGRLLTPAGKTTLLGDFPLGIALSPDGRWAVVSNAGQGEGAKKQGNESLQLIDARTGRVTQQVTDHLKGQDTFYNGGLAFSPDGKHLWATGGGNDAVYDYAFDGGRLKLTHSWPSTVAHGTPSVGLGTPVEGIPATAPEVGDVVGYSRGVTLTPDGKTAVVTNEQGGSVSALDTATGAIRWQAPLGANQQHAGTYPNGVAVTPDGATAFIAAQGVNAVYALSLATGTITGVTPVGDHPVSITLTPSGKQAFVTDANDDSVSVLSISGGSATLTRQLSTHLLADEVNGSSPVAAAYDASRHRLYVTNAGDNTVAVLGGTAVGTDLAPASVRLLGQIPTGFYPTAVAVDRASTVYAVTAKGYGGVPVTDKAAYDGNDMIGTLSRVPAPSVGQLKALTRQAQTDQLWGYQAAEATRPASSPIPTWAHAGQSPIKHVVLVVRENRTFDQEFGDLKTLGHPDARVHPSYLEFGLKDRQGRTVTPNAHAIAAQYGVSDNFFSDGEASIQGHDWTTEGTSTYYTESAWTQYYSSRNHTYDPTGPITYPRCGALFQQLLGAGKTVRNFGELVGVSTAQAPTVNTAPGAACPTPGGASDGPSAAAASPAYPNNLTLTSVKDTDRLTEFKNEYAPFVSSGQVPQFTYVLMGNDHTNGTTAGQPTPQALVATNDQAVGGLIDYLSHTPEWSSTAVFVEEDDSQDGLDHVDGHRNILLVASPYARHGTLSHIHASQASVTAIIDRILGVQPLTTAAQYASIPYDLFTNTPNTAPYSQRIPTYPQTATNPAAPAGTAASVPVNTSGIDLAGPVLEAQLWQATNPGSPMPSQLLAELATRGGVTRQALDAWRRGQACDCRPLQPGLTVAPGYGDSDG